MYVFQKIAQQAYCNLEYQLFCMQKSRQNQFYITDPGTANLSWCWYPGGQPPRDPLLFAVKLTQFSSSFFKGKIYDSFPAKYRHNWKKISRSLPFLLRVKILDENCAKDSRIRLPLKQCDQIRRNFATLAKTLMYLGN